MRASDLYEKRIIAFIDRQVVITSSQVHKIHSKIKRYRSFLFLLLFMMFALCSCSSQKNSGSDGTNTKASYNTDPMVLHYDVQPKEFPILDCITMTSNTNLIGLPLNGTVNVIVDWGDGTKSKSEEPGLITHVYEQNGEYTVRIFGTLTHFGNDTSFYNSEPTNDFIRFQDMMYDLKKVSSWGNLGLTNLNMAFLDAVNLTSVPNYLPPTVTDISGMFVRAKRLNSENIINWDVSNVTDMRMMFANAGSFNQDIGNWDVSNVRDMSGMFMGIPPKCAELGNSSHTPFNQDIGEWDVSSVTNLSMMFKDAHRFNQDLSCWNISPDADTTNMFVGSPLE